MPRLQEIPLICSLLQFHNWKVLRVLLDGLTTDRVCLDCAYSEYNIEPGEEYIGFSDKEWNMVGALPQFEYRPGPIYYYKLTQLKPGDIIVYPNTGIVSIYIGTHTERVKQLCGRDV